MPSAIDVTLPLPHPNLWRHRFLQWRHMGYRPQRWHDEIILFLGRELGIPCEVMPFPWPPHLPTASDISAVQNEGLQDYLVEQGAEFAAEHVLTAPIRFITWDATEFLGRKPTPSQSASISRALGQLERCSPPFVQRRRLPGEKRRRRVRLTAHGSQRYRFLERDPSYRRQLQKLVKSLRLPGMR